MNRKSPGTATLNKLRGDLRNIIAVSMLPAIWLNYNTRQIAESMAEVLVNMIGLDFAYVWIDFGHSLANVHLARIPHRTSPEGTLAIRAALAPWFKRLPPGDTINLPNPIGNGTLHAFFTPIAAGDHAAILAASHRADFPSESERLLLRVTANQAAVSILRTRAGEELRQLNETLEQRVASEIAERMKAEEALRHTQKMEAVGKLTGGVAHDFNNLLQVILGNLELMRHRMEYGAAGAEFGKMMDAAIRGAERGAALTQRLLAFARRQPLDPRPIDLNELATGLSALLVRSLGERIRVETALGAGTWQVMADRDQLETAVLNLCVNARDAMAEGGTIIIETANTYLDHTNSGDMEDVVPGQYGMVAVTDTGTGMAQDVAARAIEPFFTTKEIGGGTGLGLSQVYGFVKQSGGHMTIDSEPGKGTTVRLYLARANVGQAGDAPAAPVRFIPQASANELILAVEDDADVRANSVRILRQLGYAVLEAPDGREALHVLEDNPEVRVLFTDIGLPGPLDGRQLADEALKRNGSLKVLFTTGYAEKAAGTDGCLKPGTALIVKPFTYSGLAGKVRALLDRDQRTARL